LSHLVVKKNLAAWNVQNDVYIVDLQTKKIKILKEFFKIFDIFSTPIFLDVDFENQKLIGFSKSLKTRNFFMHFGDEILEKSDSTKIELLSEKYRGVREIESCVILDDERLILGGAIEKKGHLAPFVMISRYDETIMPLGGMVVKNESARSISCMLLIGNRKNVFQRENQNFQNFENFQGKKIDF